MNYIGKISMTLAAAAAMSFAVCNAYAEETKVEINSLTGNNSEIVAYTIDEAPVEIDNTLYVAARITAYAMGMTTEWDQDTLTATLRIESDKHSSMPIECFAYEMSSVVDNHEYDIEPKDISIDIKPGSQYALLKLNYTDKNGDEFTLGKNVRLDGMVRMLNADTLMFPVRSVCESIGLDIGWTQESRTVSVDIPQVPEIMSGLGVLDENAVIYEPETVVASSSDINIVSEAVSEPAAQEKNEPGKVYLGTFKITHYAPGAASNGIWGNATAWAGDITPGVTIAVDKNVIAPLSWVYIDGYGYRRAEDCGGGVVGNMIDVAVATEAEAARLGVVYKDVYLCTE